MGTHNTHGELQRNESHAALFLIWPAAMLGNKRAAKSGGGSVVTQALLLANLVVMSFTAWSFWSSASASIQPTTMNDEIATSYESSSIPIQQNQKSTNTSTTTAGIGSVDSSGFYFVKPKEGERDFYKIGLSTSTDKVQAPTKLPGCLKNDALCTRPNCTRPECRRE